MNFPVTRTIGHKAYNGSTRNSRGNTVDSWAAVVSVPVYGWHVPATWEPQIPGHERVRFDVQVLAPASFRPGPKDLIVVPGFGDCEIVGVPQDYNNGPWQWDGDGPGNVINAKKVTG